MNERVDGALRALGLDCPIATLPDSTRSAPEAAAAIGCEIGQIAKSIVFRGMDSGGAVLVVASGANRVDEFIAATLAGEPLAKADAEFVRRQTGFAIGGVPPLGHAYPLKRYFDESLTAFAEVWAAAGTPHSVFRLRQSDLRRLAEDCFVRICRAVTDVDAERFSGATFLRKPPARQPGSW